MNNEDYNKLYGIYTVATELKDQIINIELLLMQLRKEVEGSNYHYRVSLSHGDAKPFFDAPIATGIVTKYLIPNLEAGLEDLKIGYESLSIDNI